MHESQKAGGVKERLVGRIVALLSQKIIKKIEPALLGNAEQKCEVLDASYS